jgi:hypothetical protein
MAIQIKPKLDTKVTSHIAASMSLATNTLALQRAMNLTKRQLQAQGLKPNHFSLRELRGRAEQYLAEHREELIAEAKVVVERWRVEAFFGKRARLRSDAQAEGH